jgi:putative tryptophan/tyrosine transport system substrate-binding protein
MLYQENDPEGQLRARALVEGLEACGWQIGTNLLIDFRWGSGDLDWVRSAVTDMLRSGPDVVLANSDQAARAAQPVSRTVPVVFIAASDAVREGFVQSLARPGGNMTGFAILEPTIGPKWLELLREIAPQVTRVAVLFNADNGGSVLLFHSAADAAEKFGLEVTSAPIRTAVDIEAAMEMLGRKPNGGFIVPPDPATATHRKLIVSLAARYRLPAVYSLRSFASDGGLASYGINLPALFRQAADYVDRILQGQNPADLPVQRPTKFELIINLQTAKALGLDLESSLIALADELIE